jgi:hypothetical protein
MSVNRNHVGELDDRRPLVVAYDWPGDVREGAAGILGFKASTLRSRIRKLGIHRAPRRADAAPPAPRETSRRALPR